MTENLDALAGEAAKVDAGAAGAPPNGTGPAAGAAAASQEPAKMPTSKQLELLLGGLIEKAGTKFPSIVEVWKGPGALPSFCEALGPLLDKYDVDAFGFVEQWRVELTAAFVCVPLLWMTAKAIRADIETAQRADEKVVNPAPGSGDVKYDPHAGPKAGPNAVPPR